MSEGATHVLGLSQLWLWLVSFFAGIVSLAGGAWVRAIAKQMEAQDRRIDALVQERGDLLGRLGRLEALLIGNAEHANRIDTALAQSSEIVKREIGRLAERVDRWVEHCGRLHRADFRAGRPTDD